MNSAPALGGIILVWGLMLVLYIGVIALLFWLLFRLVRAVERIADAQQARANQLTGASYRP